MEEADVFDVGVGELWFDDFGPISIFAAVAIMFAGDFKLERLVGMSLVIKLGGGDGEVDALWFDDAADEG